MSEGITIFIDKIIKGIVKGKISIEFNCDKDGLVNIFDNFCNCNSSEHMEKIKKLDIYPEDPIVFVFPIENGEINEIKICKRKRKTP